MISQSRIRHQPVGVTLVEILLVVILVAGMIIGGVTIMTQFQKWFMKGGDTGNVLQDVGISLAYLRHDLLNVVGDESANQAAKEWEYGIAVSSECLSLRTFLTPEGTVAGVDYVYHPAPAGGTLQRIQANSSEKILIHQRITSLSWKLASESISIPGSTEPHRRVWIVLRITVGGQGRLDTRAGEVTLETTFFPKRLNAQLNWKD